MLGYTYLLVYFSEGGSAVYNFESSEVIEFNPCGLLLERNKYRENIIYVPYGCFFEYRNDGYFSVNGNEIDEEAIRDMTNMLEAHFDGVEPDKTLLSTDSLISIQNYHPMGSGSGFKGQTYDAFNTLVECEYEIPYSWYYRYQKADFGYLTLTDLGLHASSQGLCEFVAANQMLQYFGLFKNPNVFTHAEANLYFAVKDSYQNDWRKSHPYVIGDQNEERVADSLTTKIYTLCGTNYRVTGGMIAKAVEKFLVGKDVTFNAAGQFLPSKSKAKTKIKEIIRDKKVPAIISANLNDIGAHDVVVYGITKSGDLLAHFGWDGGNYSQTILNVGFTYFYTYWTMNEIAETDANKHSLFKFYLNNYSGKEINDLYAAK